MRARACQVFAHGSIPAGIIYAANENNINEIPKAKFLLNESPLENEYQAHLAMTIPPMMRRPERNVASSSTNGVMEASLGFPPILLTSGTMRLMVCIPL